MRQTEREGGREERREFFFKIKEMEREETQRGRESRSQNQDMDVRAERNFVSRDHD